MHHVKGSDLLLTEVSENSLSWDQQVPGSSSKNTFHFHHICCTFLRMFVFRGLYYISVKNAADLSLHHSTEIRSDQAWYQHLVRWAVPTATATDCNGSFIVYLRCRYLHFRHTEVSRISPTWVIPTKLIPLAPEVLEESGNKRVPEGLGALHRANSSVSISDHFSLLTRNQFMLLISRMISSGFSCSAGGHHDMRFPSTEGNFCISYSSREEGITQLWLCFVIPSAQAQQDTILPE